MCCAAREDMIMRHASTILAVLLLLAGAVLANTADKATLSDPPAITPPTNAPKFVMPTEVLYDNGPFPMTLTTTTVTLDGSRGGDPYRIIQGEPYGGLEFDFPASAADLTRQVTGEESATEGRADEFLLYAGPIDFPTDIDGWLEGAVSLDVVDQGTLTRPDGEAAWWDLQVNDPAATRDRLSRPISHMKKSATDEPSSLGPGIPA